MKHAAFYSGLDWTNVFLHLSVLLAQKMKCNELSAQTL